ncbi:hypothetical protein [Gallaecimonas mangrovi]|uniref:hypothetical protein n=1 Tax=Gallaecimonas mangrovi TaxID=2291597 RepID=UPI001260276E|nr:hypothetical protein [Gallaecimonas mangrovi]
MTKQGLFFTSLAVSIMLTVLGCQAQESETVKPKRAFEVEVGKSRLHYLQYNAELYYPCPKVSLTRGKKVLDQRDLCTYQDRFGNSFDIRNDISFVEIDDARVEKNKLAFTVDVSLKGATAFLLKCTLAFDENKLGEQHCTVEDLPK